jgi:NADH-quinone oxidoreductase subunit C
MSWLDSVKPTCILRPAAALGQPLVVFLPKTQVLRAAKALLRAEYYLEDVCCMDSAEGLVVSYHLDHFVHPGRVCLRVLVPYEAPSLPSMAGIYQGAEWHERECMDFYPVTFTGNPNPSRLILPDDMVEKPLAREEKQRAKLAQITAPGELEILDPAAPECVALAAREEKAA